jgi:HTH-type transcriptional regulator/antitoxin HigA
MNIELYQQITLTHDIPQQQLKQGDIATLVDFVAHPTGGETGCILEIFNALGESLRVVTVPISAIAIKPMRNEQDYQEILARIEQLMEAMPNTPEFDELDVLTTLVEAYEEKHYPIAPPNTIDAVKFRMEQHNKHTL